MPEYSPLETDDGFPVVPITDSHPYHIVVVAGQECPTESGVPRGLGGGVIRGMKLGGMQKKDKDKDKDKDKEKDRDKKEKEEEDTLKSPENAEKEEGEDERHKMLSPTPLLDEPDSSESAEPSRSASPALGHTPTLHRHNHPAGVKGWSNMLDGRSRFVVSTFLMSLMD